MYRSAEFIFSLACAINGESLNQKVLGRSLEETTSV